MRTHHNVSRWFSHACPDDTAGHPGRQHECVAGRVYAYGAVEIQLLGGLVFRQGERLVDRFRTRKGGEMLAALALYLHRALTREELLALLWPEDDPELGRNRLRVELAALKRQFQDQGQAGPTLIEAHRLQVRLKPEAFATDVAEFEQGLAQAGKATERTEQIALLAQAVEFYHGDLLPGYDAEWIVAERERLAALHQEALRKLIRRLAQERRFRSSHRLCPARLAVRSLERRGAFRPDPALRCSRAALGGDPPVRNTGADSARTVRRQADGGGERVHSAGARTPGAWRRSARRSR